MKSLHYRYDLHQCINNPTYTLIYHTYYTYVHYTHIPYTYVYIIIYPLI